MKSIFDNLTINKNIAIPLYYQLKSFMLENINNGILKEGDMVPAEDELCKTLNISRPTVRQAFKELASEGYLERRRAKGTYITKPPIYNKFLSTLVSFNTEMLEKGMEPKTEVLSFKIVDSNEEVNKILHNQGRLIYLERVRFADGTPVVYFETYIPYEQYKDILNVDMTINSLYENMNALGAPVIRVERFIQASAANSFEAKQLKIAKNSPLLLCKTTGYSQDGIPVEYSVARYRGDSNTFKIQLSIDNV